MPAPEFSIIVPTRNRSAQIAATLMPLLGLEQADYEIVVSDNSDADEAARTAALVAGLADAGPIRIVQPPRVLNMVDHWNFAVKQAQGRYLGIVTDRMTLMPSTLRRVRAHLDDDTPCVSFAHTTLSQQDGGWSLRPPLAPGAAERVAAEPVLRLFARGGATKACPRLLNCFVRADVLARMEAEAGAALLGISPDYSFLFNYLARHPHFVHLSRHLLVDHAPQVSNGVAATRMAPNKAYRDFMERTRAEQADTLALRPLPDNSVFFCNLVLAEYILAGRTTPGASLPPLDPAGIHAACWAQARKIAVAGNPESDAALRDLDAFRIRHGLPDPGLLARLSMAWRKVRNARARARVDRNRELAPPSPPFDARAELRRGKAVADALKAMDGGAD